VISWLRRSDSSAVGFDSKSVSSFSIASLITPCHVLDLMEASDVEEGFAGVTALVVITWPILFALATAGLMKLELPVAELATAGFTALDGGSADLSTARLLGIGIGTLESVLLATALLAAMLVLAAMLEGGEGIADSGAAKEVTEPSDNRTETGFEGVEVAATVAAVAGTGAEALDGGVGAGSAVAVDSIFSIGFPSLTAWSVR
jgi:hypothetical protein